MPHRISIARHRSAQPGESIEPPGQVSPQCHPSALAIVSLVTTCSGLLYALYRGYYGLGGTIGMIGRPADQGEWRAINLAGAAILLVLALLPVAVLPLWRRRGLRRVLLGLCWLLAVGFVAHALINDTQRVLSLAGVLQLRYPAFWATINRRAADLQDLVFNETWFLAQGLLWGLIGWMGLGPAPARRPWIVTALAAAAAATSIGLLAAFDVIGRTIVF